MTDKEWVPWETFVRRYGVVVGTAMVKKGTAESRILPALKDDPEIGFPNNLEEPPI